MQEFSIPSHFACPEIHFPGLDQLFEVYADLEQSIAAFKRGTGIDCLEKCTHCCATAKLVEASIFEMLPLSLHLWQEGRAEGARETLKKMILDLSGREVVSMHSDISSKMGERIIVFTLR